MASVAVNMAPSFRRTTIGVPVGPVTVGGNAPIVVQSMTNTDTADAQGTAAQVEALARAGSRVGAHHRGYRQGRRCRARDS